MSTTIIKTVIVVVFCYIVSSVEAQKLPLKWGKVESSDYVLKLPLDWMAGNYPSENNFLEDGKTDMFMDYFPSKEYRIRVSVGESFFVTDEGFKTFENALVTNGSRIISKTESNGIKTLHSFGEGNRVIGESHNYLVVNKSILIYLTINFDGEVTGWNGENVAALFKQYKDVREAIVDSFKIKIKSTNNTQDNKGISKNTPKSQEKNLKPAATTKNETSKTLQTPTPTAPASEEITAAKDETVLKNVIATVTKLNSGNYTLAFLRKGKMETHTVSRPTSVIAMMKQYDEMQKTLPPAQRQRMFEDDNSGPFLEIRKDAAGNILGSIYFELNSKEKTIQITELNANLTMQINPPI